jgi:hypothetical protein
MSEAPPPYENVSTGGTVPSFSNSEKSPSQYPPNNNTKPNFTSPYTDPAGQRQPTNFDPILKPSNPQPGVPNASRFPKEFGFYHASGSSSDMVIAFHATDAPLFYVSTHSGWSSQPSVVLHSSSSPSAPPLATAQFHGFSSSIDVQLFAPGTGQIFKLENTGTFTRSYMFPAVMASGEREMFEWKSSSGADVQSLEGKSHGMKLVRMRSGEVVAAWTRANSGYKKKGKISFLRTDKGALGEGFELMVVVSILAIMEKARRKRNNASASGAGAGGGGC